MSNHVMSTQVQSAALPVVRQFNQETLIKGQPTQVPYLQVADRMLEIEGKGLTIARLENEWYEDLDDPQTIIEALRSVDSGRPDLFTFWQRVPDVTPRFNYPMNWEQLAVLSTVDYDHWWNTQIKSRTRSLIRKAQRDVEVRETAFDDEFVRGMTAIFNESPVRQGRRFWHYGKDEATVRQQFSRYLHRERMIGAYLGNELIGFVMLGIGGHLAVTGQVLSAMRHRDRSPNNLLITKCVELCAASGITHLSYLYWSDDSLAEFKRRCGFQKVSVPRYFVPLTRRGEVALKLGLQYGVRRVLPPAVTRYLKQLRSKWYGAVEA
jgi:hypothetical protein